MLKRILRNIDIVAMALLVAFIAVNSVHAANTPNNTQMLTDKTGAVIPQFWDSTALVWRAISATYPQPNGVSVSVTSNDITKFGGTNLSTGLGASGAGIPRVTVSSDTVHPVTFAASATGGYSFTHIATSTDTVVKASAGTLHGINVNTKGTVASAITIYNNTTCTGAVIAVIDSLTLSGLFVYDVAASVGICVTTTGTVAPDVTALYK